MDAIVLTIPHLDAQGFIELCQANQDLRLERTTTGEIIIMPPTYPWTGKQNFGLVAQLGVWIQQTGLGIGFDSSTGFTLPNGAVRSPDVSWVSNERWEALTIIFFYSILLIKEHFFGHFFDCVAWRQNFKHHLGRNVIF